MKAWWHGVEPGTKILNWLELGSKTQWALNMSWLAYGPARHNFFPFVFTGQDVDKKLYDHLNSYTGEKGSDGVIRVCAANMNYRYLKLRQNVQEVLQEQPLMHRLEIVQQSCRESQKTPLAVIPGASHSGDKMGIMKSVSVQNAGNKPVVDIIAKALQVKNEADYGIFTGEMADYSTAVQAGSGKYSMVIFYLHDDRGNDINDYDLLLLFGDTYDPDKFPSGFFIDRQRNSIDKNRLTYYVRSDKTAKFKDRPLGIRVVARPQAGFSYYTVGEFRSGQASINELITENMTTLVEIELKRHVDRNILQFHPLTMEREDFTDTELSGKQVP